VHASPVPSARPTPTGKPVLWAQPATHRTGPPRCPMARECTRCPNASKATVECDQNRVYERHRPEAFALCEVVNAGLRGFLAERAERDAPAPALVEQALRACLRCGLLEHGFCRSTCDACGHELAVALSCKNRGFCRSCLGRRMNDGAADLVDRGVPEVPIRQGVLSLSARGAHPHAARFRPGRLRLSPEARSKARTHRTLKKSVHGLFQRRSAEVNSAPLTESPSSSDSARRAS
jgi:hypothetical protein